MEGHLEQDHGEMVLPQITVADLDDSTSNPHQGSRPTRPMAVLTTAGGGFFSTWQTTKSVGGAGDSSSSSVVAVTPSYGPLETFQVINIF